MSSKSKLIFFSAILLLITIVGCGPTIYLAPTFEEYRTSHQNIAIMPFDVIIDPNKLPNDYTLDMKNDAEEAEAYNFQQELYMRFLKRHEKNEYTIKFQDIDKTNALLKQSGITNTNLKSFTKEQLYRVVNTDVILSGTIHRSKPMSTTGAVVLGVLFGAWGNTNEVNISMNLHDAKSGELLWKYDHKASGSVGSSSEKLAESLMKNVSKKFPYKRPKN